MLLYPTANPRVASAQAMATAVVKRPITQPPAPGVPLPPPAVTAVNENIRPPPIPPIVTQGTSSNESGSEYSHYNSKLTIENFDLLKVSYLLN